LWSDGPSERWGQEVVALVAVKPGHELGTDQLHAQCTARLARFKAPKEFIFVDQIRRLGKRQARLPLGEDDCSTRGVAGMTHKGHRLPGQCALRRKLGAARVDGQGAG
jgi:hypothetical protein